MPAPPSLSRRAYPLWVHLALFAVAILLPLWLALGAGVWMYVDHARRSYERQTLQLARKLGTDLDRRLTALGGMLQALATSPAIDTGDFARFQQQAAAMAPPGGAIVLRDPSGQQLVNTLFPYGTPLPATGAGAVRSADECVFRTAALCVQ